jgi:hypothetical protein
MKDTAYQGRRGVAVDPKDDFDRWITEREHDGRHRDEASR